MIPIHLLIPDPALREAVVEQLQLAKLGKLQESGALPDAPPNDPMVAVIDEAAADAKTVKKFQAIRNDKMVVLWLGAERDGNDDMPITEVFAKPLRLGHLLARLRFYIDVAPKLRAAPIAIGPYQFSAQQRSLTDGGNTIRLTEKETGLLEYLAQSGNPVGREELLAGVWGYDARIDTHTLETHIYQLRRKIGNELIMNEGGLYRLAK